MRRLSVLVLATAVACTSEVTPQNPYDPATPLTLQAKARVFGTVETGASTPFAGLDVYLRQNGQLLRSFKTDPAGAFVFDSLTPGSYAVEAKAPGFSTVSIPLDLPAGADVDVGAVTMVPAGGASTGSLRGSALLGRMAAPGDPVVPDPSADNAGIHIEAVGTPYAAVTTSTGDYELSLPPGLHTLRISHPNYVSQDLADLPVTLGLVSPVVVVVLATNPAKVSGQVVAERPDGSVGPLADALVTLDGTSATGLTKADGSFTLDQLAPGSYLLRVLKDGYVTASVPVLDLVGGETRALVDPLTLSLERGAIHGTVKLADTPGDASGVVVEVSGTGRAVVTGADGAYAFDGLVAGSYQVRARHDGYGEQVTTGLGVTAGAVVDVPAMTLLRQGGTVAIKEGVATGSTAITLVLGAPAAASWRASEDPTFQDAALGDTTGSHPYTGPGMQVPFTLSSQDGAHQVYVVFLDASGGASAPASAAIVLDRVAPTAPSVTIGSGGAFTRTSPVGLTLSAQDQPATPGAAVSGLSKMELADNSSFTNAVLVDYNLSSTWALSGGDGLKAVYARFYDRAGNRSAAAVALVTLDTQEPLSPTLTLSGGPGALAGTTASPLVTATLSATDDNAGAGSQDLLVRLANDAGFAGASWQPYAPSVSWLLLPGDGAKTVFAQFMDPAGNRSQATQASITLSGTAPTAGSVAVAGGAAATSQQLVPATIFATGASAMRLSVDGVPQPAGWVPYATTATVDLGATPDEATRVVAVSFRNSAGVEGGGASTSIVYDHRVPTGASLAINGGAAFTGSTTVTLTLGASDAPAAAGGYAAGLASVELADNPGFAGFTSVPYATTAAYVLTGGEGTSTVWARFRDRAGNVSDPVSKSIVYDRTVPANATIAVVGNAGAPAGTTGTPVVTVTLGATDANDGGAGRPLLQMRLSADPGFAGASWQPFQAVVSWSLTGGDGPKTVYAQFMDGAGNTSVVVHADIALAATPPSGGAITVEGGAAATRKTTGALAAIQSTGAATMRLSVNGVAQGGWVPAAGSATVDLTGVADETTCTVAVVFRNAGGLEGGGASTAILVDRRAPTAGAVTINGGAAFTSTLAVTLSLSALDAPLLASGVSSGLDKVEVSNDAAFATSTVVPLVSTLSWSLAAGADGARTVYARFRDRAGNVSGTASALVSYDLTKPAAAAISLAGSGNAQAGYTASPVVTATLAASDLNDGGPTRPNLQMRLSSDAGFAGAAYQPFAPTTTFALPGGDGLKTVWAQFRDAAGNESLPVSATITLATAPPAAGTISLPAATSAASVAAVVSASGADKMLISVNGVAQPAGWIPYATGATVDLGASPDEALRTVTVLFRSLAGVDGAIASTTIVMDRTAPTFAAGAVTLNGGAAYTGSRAVTLSLAASDGPVAGTAASGLTTVELSNDGFATFASVPYAATVPWSLASGGGDGLRTVSARFRDRAGNLSLVATGAITLDTAGPTGVSITLAGNATARSSLYTGTPLVTATVSATDPSEGPAKANLQVRLGNDNLFTGSSWQTYATSLSWALPVGDGLKTVWVQFKDGLGNLSAPASASITLAETLPSLGTIAVTSGATVTGAASVAVTLGASGADRMLLSVNGAPQPSGWVNYATTATVDLSAVPTESTATISVVFRNLGGVDGGDALTSLVVDRTAPTFGAGAVVVNGGAPYTGTRAVTLTLSAFDGPTTGAVSAGLDKVDLSNDGFATSSTFAYGATVPWTLAAGGSDGLRTVSARFRDKAGNVSPVATGAITLDTAGPTGVTLALVGNATAKSALYTGTPVVTATVFASDTNEGPAKANLQVRLGNDNLFTGSSWQTYATSLSWVLPVGDGLKTVWVQFKDAVGNQSTPVSASITLAEAPPSAGTIAVTSGATVTSLSSVGVTLGAAGADKMLIYVNGTPQAAGWVSYATSATVDLSGVPTESTANLAVVFRNTGGVDGGDALASILVDRTAPTFAAGALVVNGGATWTGSRAVTLTVLASDGPTTGALASGLDKVELSNDGFATSSAVAYGTTLPWNLAAGGSDGSRTVSARFRDKAGNVSAVTTGAIVLDTAGPTGAAIGVAGNAEASGGYTGTRVITATVSATDVYEGSGKANLQVRLGNDASFTGSSWQPYATTISWLLPPGDTLKTVYVQFKDSVGNLSATPFATITLAETPPSGGTIVVAGGAAATRLSSVTAVMGAIGADRMQLFVNGLAQGGWQAYTTLPTAVDLSAVPDQTSATVSVVFRNPGGVSGAGASASIRCDHTAPAAGALAISGTLGNGTSSVTLTSTPAVLLQITPPGGDETEMAVIQAASAATLCSASFATPLWQPVSRNASMVLSGIDGAKRACVLFRDAAGNYNVASAATANITLDATPPTNPSFVNLVSTTQNGATAPTSGKPVVTASTDATSGGVVYQCTGGTGTSYGANWVDCGGSTTLPVAFALALNTQSTLGVRARDAAYNYSPGSFVQIIHDNVAPMPPNISGVETTRDSLSLDWDASPDADVASYRVYYGNFAGDFSGTGAAQGPSPVTVPATGQAGQGYALTGLTTSYPYYVAVEAVDRAGNASGPSGQRFAQPNLSNPRLLSTVGGLQRAVGVRTSATSGRTFAYLAENQGVVQLDVTAEGALPAVTGRAALPNFVPDAGAKVVVFDCSRTNTGGLVVSGHCVVLAGSTLEGDYRADGDAYRAPSPVVFFPATTGGAGTVLTVLPARPHRLVYTTVGSKQVLVAVERSTVKAFDMTVVKAPRLLASVALGAKSILAAGEMWTNAGQSVVAYGQAMNDPYGAPHVYEIPIGNVLAGSLGLNTYPGIYDNDGMVLGSDYDQYVAVIDDGQFYVAWKAYYQTYVGQWMVESSAPFDQQLLADPANGDPDQTPTGIVAGNAHVYVFADQPPAMSDPASGPYVYQVFSDGGLVVTGQVSNDLQSNGLSAAIGVYTATGTTDHEHLLAVDHDPYSGAYTLQRFRVNDATGALTYTPYPFQEINPTWFAEAGRFLFATDDTRVFTVDVANPLFPRVVQTFNSGDSPGFFKPVVHGRYLYVANQYGLKGTGIYVFRIGGDGLLTYLSHLAVPSWGTWGDFVVRGKYVYAAYGPVVVFDVANPAVPVTVTTSAAFGCKALDVRPAVVSGTAYEAEIACGIWGDYVVLDKFQMLTFNGATVASVSGTPTLPFDVGYYHPTNVSMRGNVAVVGNSRGSVVVDVTSPTVPVVTSTLLAQTGPILFQGGYYVGLGKTGAASGPDFVNAADSGQEGTMLFSTCAGSGSLASANGVYYASCNRNGISIFAAPARGGGTQLKRFDVTQTWGMNGGAALAHDGAFSYLAGPSAQGEYGKFYTVDERTNVGANPLGPVNFTNNKLASGYATGYFLLQDGNLFSFEGFYNGTSPALRAVLPTDPNAIWPTRGAYTLPFRVGFPGGPFNTQPVGDGEFAWANATQTLPAASTTADLVTYDLRVPSALSGAYTWTARVANAGSFGALAQARDRLYAGQLNGPWIYIYDTSAGGLTARTGIYTKGAVTGITGLAVQGGYLFVTYRSSDVQPYGLLVYPLSVNRDGAGVTALADLADTVPLANPTVVGDVLYLSRNLSIGTFDLQPLWLDGQRPVPLAAGANFDQASVPPRLIIEGPWGYLVGGTYRAFDLRQ